MQLPSETRHRPQRRLTWKFILVVAFAFSLVPLAVAGWLQLYGKHLELSAPRIQFKETVRGAGVAPVNFQFSVTDTGAGLAQIIVTLRQGAKTKELFAQNCQGEKTVEIPPLLLSGGTGDLENGIAYLDIYVRDQSFWKNVAEESISFPVDQRKPLIQLLNNNLEIPAGGTQFLTFKITEDNRALFGVKIGAQTFPGFPLRALDKDIEDPSYVGVFFTVPPQMDGAPSVKIFADDQVGNSSSEPVQLRITPRSSRETTRAFSSEMIREHISPLLKENYQRVVQAATSQGEAKKLTEISKSGFDPAVTDAILTYAFLRPLNESELTSLLMRMPNVDSRRQGYDLGIRGEILSGFAENVIYKADDHILGNLVSNGEDWLIESRKETIYATNSGRVIFSEPLGVFGKTIAIDHGLGLVSVYAHLSVATAQLQDDVEKGQDIGTVGSSGFANRTLLHYEMRLNGFPVDPREWASKPWFDSVITAKLNTLKRELGIPVYRELQ